VSCEEVDADKEGLEGEVLMEGEETVVCVLPSV